MRKYKFLEVDSELGAGTRGASLGIAAMKVAALNAEDHFFQEFPSEQVETCNHCLHDPVDTPSAIRLEAIAEVYDRVSNKVREVIEEGEFPVLLSGDHSTAAGIIAGLRAALGHRRLGCIWIDAHADLHSPYTSPSGNVHGMPLAIALNEDNLEHQSNEVVGKTKVLWERVKSIQQPAPWIRPEDLVFVALRDYEPQEAYLIKKHGIKVFTVDQLRQTGAEATAQRIRDYLSECDCLYISFDVDSMDCEMVSDGTGTPVTHGLSAEEAKQLILGLQHDPRLCSMEVVEVNPTLDSRRNRMAEVAFDILQAFMREKATPSPLQTMQESGSA